MYHSPILQEGPLHEFKHKLVVVEDVVENSLSSTTVRRAVREVRNHPFEMSTQAPKYSRITVQQVAIMYAGEVCEILGS